MGTQLGLLQFDLDRRRQHVHDDAVFAVEHHQRRFPEDAGLGSSIGLHAAVPVEVVLRDVEHHGGCGFKALHAIELEARQLQHPCLRQILSINASAQRIEQCGADITGHAHAHASMLEQLAGQRSHRGLAVRARYRQHLGCIAMGLLQTLQRSGKQIQFAAHG